MPLARLATTLSGKRCPMTAARISRSRDFGPNWSVRLLMLRTTAAGHVRLQVVDELHAAVRCRTAAARTCWLLQQFLDDEGDTGAVAPQLIRQLAPVRRPPELRGNRRRSSPTSSRSSGCSSISVGRTALSRQCGQLLRPAQRSERTVATRAIGWSSRLSSRYSITASVSGSEPCRSSSTSRQPRPRPTSSSSRRMPSPRTTAELAVSCAVAVVPVRDQPAEHLPVRPQALRLRHLAAPDQGQQRLGERPEGDQCCRSPRLDRARVTMPVVERGGGADRGQPALADSGLADQEDGTAVTGTGLGQQPVRAD